MPRDRNVAVVTGAAGAVGRVVAVHLASEGWTVVAAHRGGDGAVVGPKIVEAAGIDLLTPQGLLALAEIVGHIDSDRVDLVHCAGAFSHHQRIVDTDVDDARRLWEANYATLFNAAHSLLPLMIRRKAGRVLAFGSHSMPAAYPLLAAFDCAKAAACQLVRHISNEYSQDGIAANVIAPATLDSEAERRLKPFGDHEHWVSIPDLASLVVQVLRLPVMVSGNVLHAFVHSDQYFGRGFFERIREV